MKFQNIHMNLLNTHINEYGTEGLLPQYLSASLLKIISDEYDSFNENNLDENNEDIAVLLHSILLLGREKISSFNAEETFEISIDALSNKVHSYGISIAIEEIRRADLIEITEENLPTLNNILDYNRDLKAMGNESTINDFMKGFENKI